jgi:hypothetical protein
MAIGSRKRDSMIHPCPKNKKASKYGNDADCRCFLGHVHDSRLEAGHCVVLWDMVKKREIKSYERQVKFSLDVEGVHIANHYADFVITHKDGNLEIIESKGFATDVWNLKRALTKILYPKVKYTVWWKR